MRCRFRAEEVLFFAYGAILVALMAASGHWIPPTQVERRLLLGCGALSAIVLARAYLYERASLERAAAVGAAAKSTLRVMRDFLPFVIALMFYGCIHDLTPLIVPRTDDAALIAIDHRLFGVDLSSWLGQFATPALTDVMLLCYVSLLFAPGALAALLYWKRDRHPFRDYVVSICCVITLGYIGYWLVPAVGPYVYQSTLFPQQLPGRVPSQQLIRVLDDLHGSARDCFPSLHTAATMCVLMFAWRHARGFFVIYLPIALGLFVSTVYLRYHYGIDVIAGLATAVLGTVLGPRIERAWSTKPDVALSRTLEYEAVLTRTNRLS
jgi:membrane-associated phospholipid phosphatase